VSEEVRSAADFGFLGVLLQIVGAAALFVLLIGLLLLPVGFVLELYAIYQLSRHFQRPAAWRYALLSLVLPIVAVAALSLALVGMPPRAAVTESVTTVMAAESWTLALVPLALLASFAAAVFFYRNAYRELAEASGVKEFRDASIWLLLGAVLLVVLIGAMLVLVGKVFILMGFRRLKEAPPLQGG
jgi:Predicted membrane protein